MKQILHTPSYAYAQLLAPAFRDASIGLTADETQIVITTYGVHNLPQYNMIVTLEIAAMPKLGKLCQCSLCEYTTAYNNKQRFPRQSAQNANFDFPFLEKNLQYY